MSSISRFALGAIVLIWSATVVCADKKTQPNPTDAAVDTRDIFQARDAGDIEVKLIPKDATRATVIVRNKTDRPLRIALPAEPP